jgi:hypothetical protein
MRESIAPWRGLLDDARCYRLVEPFQQHLLAERQSRALQNLPGKIAPDYRG